MSGNETFSASFQFERRENFITGTWKKATTENVPASVRASLQPVIWNGALQHCCDL